ncbi:radical SAM protein [Gramella sp. MT6]|uniref:radical SAM/SPASM domain-containing protein n=1 Tax=Gramella sp. MT6 TaxID=2705471 RepID=UPI001C6021C8|nr:radical SAM protein [Gramella sp. MT6]QYA26748.1 radical SAM protein [Gramella sp. MT6]
MRSNAPNCTSYIPEVNNLDVLELEEFVLPESVNVTGWKKSLVLLYSKFLVLQALIESYRNPVMWFKGFRYLYSLREKFFGNSEVKKICKVRDKYYSSLYAPAINDLKFKTFIKSELNRYKELKASSNRFNHVFLAITKKCPLQCEHCYEWDRLNKNEKFNEDKLNFTLKKLEKEGVSQIYLTGGEPLIKFNTILNLLKNADPKTELWINTSGYQLTNERARKLKSSGLTGVFISLDHYLEEEHNNFRKNSRSFYWVMQGTQNSLRNGLVVTLSLCVRKEFLKDKNLANYMDLARKLGVSFVQFIEPKAVGHYKNTDISLKKEQVEKLESFFETYNFDEAYTTFPLICYHEYYQRRSGCLNTNNRGLYIDPDGGINPCPFCHKVSGNILNDDFEESLKTLRQNGCQQF